MSTNEEMIAQTTVLKMGWTKTMIEKMLPEPTLVNNPHYKNAAPMKLFKKADVLAAMDTDEYRDALEKANRRKKSAEKAVETKEKRLSDKMRAFVESINVEVLPTQELINRTIEAKRKWYEWNWKDFYGNVDEDTLDRWVVNYIRHNLVEYDEGLWNMRGKTGRNKVYREYKNAILEKIAAAYPMYADECKYQKTYFYI